MTKKILGCLAILAIAGAAAFNMQMNSKVSGLSDIALANIEALARREGDDNNCYSAIETHATDNVHYCSWDCNSWMPKSRASRPDRCN